MSETIKAYKGFNADWTCRGFQYEVGKTYTHDGAISLCESGFHACENPLDIFNYYAPTGQLAEVELVDVDTAKEDGDSKRVAKSITIKASLTIPGLVAAAIEYTTKRCDPVKVKHATGDRSASSATGDRSASSATGDRSASSATGYQSASSATGYQSASSATGEDAIAAAFGFDSRAQAGKTGIVIVAWYDKKAERKRLTVGYVGENGIEPDVWYRCDEAGTLICV